MYKRQGIDYPLAIRYPRGKGYIDYSWKFPFEKINIGSVSQIKKGNKFAFISVGTIGNNVIKAMTLSNSEDWSHYHFSFVKPLNEEALHSICQQYERIITIEDGTVKGGFGSMVSQFVTANYPGLSVQILGVKDEFIEHATVLEQQQACRIDIESIVEIINK